MERWAVVFGRFRCLLCWRFELEVYLRGALGSGSVKQVGCA